MAKNDKKKKTTTALLKPGVESKSAFTKVSPSSLAKSTGTTTTTVKSGGKTTTKTTRTTTGGQTVTKKQPKVNSKSAAQAKKEKTSQKAKKQKETASYMGLNSSNLSPLNALRRDALTGTTTRDKITYAKTTGLGKKPVGYNERSKAIKEKQDAKNKKNKEQTLSEHDSKLNSRDQNLIRDAKTDWDLAKEAGDQTGMDRAHKRAEKVRQRSGYSGGLSGSKYESPELTAEEKAKLNQAGETALKIQKMRLERAKKGGSEDEIAAAEAGIKQVLENNAYLDRAHKRAEKVGGHGTSVDVGATETLEEFGENANSFAQAATAGVLGAIPALVETSAKATDNLVRKNNKADLEKWANNLDHYEFLLSQVKAGNKVNGETESSLEQKVRIATNAKELLESGTIVDPTLPGQSMLRKSAEETEKYMEGKTGVSKLLASAGLSVAQMAPVLAAGALVPGAGAAVATGLMGAQAAGQKSFELNERNIDPAESQVRGIISGGIETLAEKIPVESLLKVVKAGGGSSMIRNIAKQAGLEATEESASYALNYLADKAAKDPEAKFSMQELAESAAVGAISGGALAGGGTVLNRVVGNSTATQERPSSKVEQFATNAVQRVKESGKNRLLDIVNREKTSNAPQEAATEALPSVQEQVPTQRQETAQVAVQPEAQVQQERRESGQVSRGFETSENHIDNRTPESVAARSTKSFQFDHPELHPYFVQAAEALKRDAEYSMETQSSQRGKGTVVRRSEALGKAEDMGLTRNEIIKVCDDIIADNGQENYAAAKRVELVLNDMLTHGYIPNENTTIADSQIPANQEYIQAKNSIEGALDGFEQYKRQNKLALELGEVTEEELRQEYEALNAQEEASDNVIRFPGSLPEGMGAMSSGGAGEFSNWQNQRDSFHPINEEAYRRTKEFYGRARVEVPTRDLEGKLTSKTVSTLANAGITSNQFVESIEADAAAGGFSYEAYGDKDALAQAETKIKDIGYQRAKEEWISQVKAGKFTKDNVALGLTLINNAANSGTLEGHIDAHDLVSYYIDYARTGAQALQATSILNKMTPTGQLYVITRTIDNLNQEVQTRQEKAGKLVKDPETGLTRKQAEEIAVSIEQERDDAIRAIQNMISSFSEEKKADTEKVSWVQHLGEDLARNAVRRISDKRSTRTIYKDILSDLNAFMSQYVDAGINARQPPRTATERLADYYHNRDEYLRAWEIAKEKLNEKYPNGKDVLKGFINADDPVNKWPGEDKVIIKAIAESIAEQEISKRRLVVRGELDTFGLVDDIVRDVSQVTGIPYEETSDLIEGTLLENIQERLEVDGRSAEGIIKEDVRKAMRDIGVTFADVLKRGNVGREVLSKYLSEELVNRHGISRFGADEVGAEVASIYYGMIEEKANKTLQNILGKKNRQEKRTAADRLDEMIRLGAFNSPNFRESATEKLFGDPGIEIPSELLHDFMQANTDRERREIRKEIYKSVATQVPATWRDKFDAWRYTSMLGTLRTQDRNILGNLGFAPVRLAKNAVGAGLEKAFSRGDRTKSVLNPLAKRDRARYLAGLADFKEIKEVVMAGGKYDELKSEIRDNQKVFKFAPLEAYRKATSWGLEAGDQLFSSTAYADSLAGWLKANRVEGDEFLKPDFDPARKQAAREYATKEAQKATYRDLNAASELVTRLGSLHRSDSKFQRGVGVFVEGALPFKKTPVNILVRGLEYSPFGLAKGAGDAYVTARSKSWKNAKDGNFWLTQKVAEGKRSIASGAKTSSEVIDEIASGLTGTALVALGAGLAAAGVITGGGSGDDKQDEFDSLQGHQNYAVEVGGKSFTLDWLAPEALPFFVGVELFKHIHGLQTGESNKADWAKSVTKIAEPMLEMSMLQSLNDILTSYNTEAPLISVVASAAVSYISQFVPTIGGQIERTMEDTRQTTFIDKDSAVPVSIQRMLGNIGNKIPGWEYNQTDYLDAWGRKQSTGTVLNRAINNFLNPSYTSDINTTAVETELQRLYDAGYDGVFPSAVQRSSELDNKHINAEQWTAWQTTKGQEAYKALRSIVGTESYNALTDEEKADYIDKIFDLANEAGKVAAGSESDDSSYNKAIEFGYTDVGEIAKILVGKKKYDIDENDSYTQFELYDYISNATDDAAEQEKMWNFLKNKGTTKSFAEIKKDNAPKLKAVKAAKSTLDNTVSAEKQSAFAEAVSGYNSQKDTKAALRSVDATDSERIAYYNFVKAKKGWKKTWYQIKG